MRGKMNKLLAYMLVMIMTLNTSVTAVAEGNTTVSGNEMVIVEEGLEETVSDNTVSEGDLTEEITDEGMVSDNEEEAEEIPEVDTDDENNESVISEETTEPFEETVSDNAEVEKEATSTEEFVFPGLPEGYSLSSMELDDKSALSTTVKEMGDLNEGDDYVAGEVLFACDTVEEAELYAAAYGAELKSFADGVAVITLPKEVSVMRAVQAAADADTLLPAVHPNYYRSLFETDEEITDVNNYKVSVSTYDDPMLSPESDMYQWHHQVVGSTYAWNNMYTGKSKAYKRQIRVAVIDSGISLHEDLEVYSEYDALTGATTGVEDSNEHGTHVAGIIAARGENSKGGSGIAPGVRLFDIKVFGDSTESGTSATLIRAINKAIEYDVDIINMSLGGMGKSVAEQNVITKAKAIGIAVFVAAGNDGSMTKMYPAAYDGAIAIAATDTNNARAYFSNYGSWIALSAPGVNIYSTIPGGYGVMSGTSQATPVAAGTAAVILGADHKDLYDKNGNALTGAAKVDALLKIMQSNVIKATGSKIGKGIANLPKALKLSTIAGTPNKPMFYLTDGSVAKGGTVTTVNLQIKIVAEEGMTIYYTQDGKNPSYKNGVATGFEYTGIFDETVGMGGKKMTLKAIAVNAAGKVSKVASVTYTFKPLVTAVKISGLNKVVAGKSIALKAAVTPVNAANNKVKWSISGNSKETGVSINASSGKVTTKSTATPGTYTVTATSKDAAAISTTYEITVLAKPRVGSMYFLQKNVTFERNSKASQTKLDLWPMLTIRDSNGSTLSNKDNVAWSSNKTSVATIDTNGVLTAKTAGKAVITASAADGSGKTAKITVTVVQMPESLEITGSRVLAKGKAITLKAEVGPEKTNNKKVTWTISGDPDTTGVSVDKNGKVRAKANAEFGIYNVYATTVNGVQEVHDVRIEEEPIKSIKFIEKSGTIFRVEGKGNTPTTIKFPFEITGGGSFDPSYVAVTNSAPGVANVSVRGQSVVVTATGEATGKVNITLKTLDGGNKSAKITVNVINPISNLTLSPEAGRSQVIAKGKSLKLSAVFETEYGALDKQSKKLVWRSTNEAVATVNSSGVVKAKSGYNFENNTYGHATIIAEAADKSGVIATYEVYTQEQTKKLCLADQLLVNGELGWYEVKKAEFSISEDEVGLYPICPNRNLSWYDEGIYPEVNLEINKPDIATVDTIQNGENLYLVIYPYTTGTVKVKVKPIDGSSASATLTVKITE